MIYTEVIKKLQQAQFERIERDDRLLDIFPYETREKGVELWTKWEKHTVHCIKIRLPYDLKKIYEFEFDRTKVETWLTENTIQDLSSLKPHQVGEIVIQSLS